VNRKSFFKSLAASIAAPFAPKPVPKPEPQRHIVEIKVGSISWSSTLTDTQKDVLKDEWIASHPALKITQKKG
jgi:hypothetical protein